MKKQIKPTVKAHLSRGAFLLVIFFVVIYIIPFALAQWRTSKKPSTDPLTQWFWQNPRPQGNHLIGVSFTDANNGTAVSWYGLILRTTDGGASWVTQNSGTGE